MNLENIKLSHLNVRSLQAHLNYVALLIDEHDLDMLAVTETWLTDTVDTSIVTLQGYDFVRRDFRGRGSGVGVYVRQGITYDIVQTPDIIEQLCICVKLVTGNLYFCVMYRNFDNRFFLNELENTIGNCLLVGDRVIIMGDMNIDLLKDVDPFVVQYNNLIADLSLSQLITEPTRVTENTQTLIDHLLVSDEEIVVKCGVVDVHSDVSDHDMIYCVLNCEKQGNYPIFLSRRDLRRFDRELFYADLTASNLDYIYSIDDVDIKINFLTDVLLTLFDLHAPIRNIRVTKRPAPWLTDTVRLLIDLRNKAKSRFRRSRLPSDWACYKSIRNYTNLAIKNEKKAFFISQFQTSNSKRLYAELKKINITSHRRTHLPDVLKDAEKINNHFIDNIPNNHNMPNRVSYYTEGLKCDDLFSFKLIDRDFILQILLDIKTNACGYDGLTVSMIKDCSPLILSHLTHIFNSCILCHRFPDCWKIAEVCPVPKIKSPTELAHLRPISILPVMSKIF